MEVDVVLIIACHSSLLFLVVVQWLVVRVETWAARPSRLLPQATPMQFIFEAKLLILHICENWIADTSRAVAGWAPTCLTEISLTLLHILPLMLNFPALRLRELGQRWCTDQAHGLVDSQLRRWWPICLSYDKLGIFDVGGTAPLGQALLKELRSCIYRLHQVAGHLVLLATRRNAAAHLR